MCDPGGVCISGRVFEDMEGKVQAKFRDLGERAFKKISRPVRVYRLAWSADAGVAASLAEAPKRPTDQPSIAVLPFSCLLEERKVRILAEAMSEDLITMLVRIPGFVAIARQSSFVYQRRTIDSRKIGRELGVRYIIRGSLRAAPAGSFASSRS